VMELILKLQGVGSSRFAVRLPKRPFQKSHQQSSLFLVEFETRELFARWHESPANIQTKV
jgi:hypothetical protein